MTPRHPEREAVERDLGSLLDTLLLQDSFWLTWLEPGPFAVRDAPDPGVRELYRGSDARPRSDRAAVLCAVFDDPYTGAGATWPAELSLASDGDAPGVADIRFELRPVHGDPAEVVSWQGPVSGRLLLHDGVVDFTAEDGARLACLGGVLVLDVSLGDDWLDRDETPRELLAAVHGLLLLRER